MAGCWPAYLGCSSAAPMHQWRRPVAEPGQKEGGRERWMVVFAVGQITPDSACRGAAGARSTPPPPPSPAQPAHPLCTSDAAGGGRGEGEASLSHIRREQSQDVWADVAPSAVHHMIHAAAAPGDRTLRRHFGSFV